MIVWFLDVDGVINAAEPVTSDHRSVPVVAQGWPVTVHAQPQVITRIAALSQTVDIRWLTTWHDDANTELAPAVGLPTFTVSREPNDGLSHSAFPRGPLAHPWWKLVAVQHALAGNQLSALIWTDDDIDHDVRQAISDAWDGPALLIRPNSRTGLTSDEVDQIAAFVAQHS